MRLKWTESQIKYFDKPTPVIKADYDWVVWAILATVSLVGLAYLILRLIK